MKPIALEFGQTLAARLRSTTSYERGTNVTWTLTVSDASGRETLAATEERIVFIIDEGPELKVRGIEFVGNRSIGDGELDGVVSVRRYPLLGAIGLGAGGYVTGRQMQQDAERLVDHYHARGFPEAKAHADAATSPDLLGHLRGPAPHVRGCHVVDLVLSKE